MPRSHSLLTAWILLLSLLLAAPAWSDDLGDGADIDVPPPAEPPPPLPPATTGGKKWGPHVDISTKFDDDYVGGLGDLFVPLWQDEDSLLFTDLRISGDNSDSVEGNIGAAYRQMLNAGWILGGYGFFDVRSSDRFGDRNTFLGGTLGLEALSENFDVRANGYIPEDTEKSAPNATSGAFSGGTILVTTGKEKALYGFDGEVGVRIPFGEDSPFWDTRIYAGGFYFDASGAKSLAGPRGRFESRIYDLPLIGDLLGEGTRLTLSAEVQHDNERGTMAFGGFALRIPFYGWFGGGHGSAPGGGLTRLERRMTDPIIRDVEIRSGRANIKSESAISVFTGEQIERAGLVDASNFAALLPGFGTNSVVGVQGNRGTIVGSGYNVAENQAIIGGGGNILVRGINSGQVVNIRVPGQRPVFDNPDNVATFFIDNVANTDIANLEILRGPQGLLYGNSQNARLRNTTISQTNGTGLEVNFTDGFIGENLSFSNIFGSQAVAASFAFSDNAYLDRIDIRDIGDLGSSYAGGLNFFNSANARVSNVDIFNLRSGNTAVGVDGFDASGFEMSRYSIRAVFGDFAVGTNFTDYDNVRLNSGSYSQLEGNIDGVGARYVGANGGWADDLNMAGIFSSGGQASGVDASNVNQYEFRGIDVTDVTGNNSAAGFRFTNSDDITLRAAYAANIGAPSGFAYGVLGDMVDYFQGSDFDIEDITGQDATGIEFSNALNSGLFNIDVSRVFGDFNAAGIRYEDSDNATVEDVEVQEIQGDFAVGLSVFSSQNIEFRGPDIREILGNSQGIGALVVDSGMFYGSMGRIRYVSGDDAAGVDIFQSPNGQLSDWQIENIDGNNFGFGVRMDFSDNSFLNDLDVDEVHGGNHGYGVNVFNVSGGGGSNWNIGKISGDIAYGGRLQFTTSYALNDFEVRDVQGQNEAYGFEVRESNGFSGDDWSISDIRASFGFARGWQFDVSLNATLRDGDIRDVRGNGGATGLQLQFSNDFFGENIEIRDIEADLAIGAGFETSLGAQIRMFDISRIRGQIDGRGFYLDGADGWWGSDLEVDDVHGDDAYGIWFLNSDMAYLQSSTIRSIRAGNRGKGVYVNDSDDWQGMEVDVNDVSGNLAIGYKFDFADDAILTDSSARNLRGDASAAGLRIRDSNQTQIERIDISSVFADDADAFRFDMTDGISLNEADVREIRGFIMDVGNSTNMSGDNNEARRFDEFCNDRGGSSGQVMFQVGVCVPF